MEAKQDFILTDNMDYYPTCGYNFTRYFEEQFNKTGPLQLVSLKNKQLKQEIVDKTKGVVGIHIRRGIGVKPHDKDGAIDYVENKVYIDIMDRMLKVNPNQKFYIVLQIFYIYHKYCYQGF